MDLRLAPHQPWDIHLLLFAGTLAYSPLNYSSGLILRSEVLGETPEVKSVIRANVRVGDPTSARAGGCRSLPRCIAPLLPDPGKL